MRNITVVLTLAVVILWNSTVLFASVFQVPGAYGTIQEAINASEAGDRVEVSSGIFAERISMKEGVSLVGTGQGQTVIDGGGTGNVIYIYKNCTIKSLTIRNGSKGIYVYSSVNGIQLAPLIEDCEIHNNSNNGIHVYAHGRAHPNYDNRYGHADPIIQNNSIHDNGHGILVEANASSYDQYRCWSRAEPYIQDNVITNNGSYGLETKAGLGTSPSTAVPAKIAGNTFDGNNTGGTSGICLGGGQNGRTHNFSKNTITGDTVYPILLNGTTASFVGNIFTGHQRNAIAYQGTIAHTGTLSPPEGMFIVISGNASISSTGHLTLLPGSVVKVENGFSLTANGLFFAEGTQYQPIIFTSIHDDTVGGDTDNVTVSPKSGDWNRVRLSSNSSVEYVEIRYATVGLEVYAHNDGTWVNPSVKYSIIHDNLESGIYVNAYGKGYYGYANKYGNTAPAINHNEIYHNGINGIKVEARAETDRREGIYPSTAVANPVITNNYIHDNGSNELLFHHSHHTHSSSSLTPTITDNVIVNYSGYGASNTTTYESSIIDASGNFWGASDGPGPVGPGSGSNVSTKIIYEPWQDKSYGYNIHPKITSVAIIPRTDGSKFMDIYYSLSDHENDACTVSIKVSNDGGANYTVPATSFVGDIGPNILPGEEKHIIWDCKKDLPGVFGNNYKIRVIADDGR